MTASEMASALRSSLRYDPETGDWRHTITLRKAKAGALAGRFDSHGYRQLKIAGKAYLAHRLAFLWMTGEWPPGPLDHINGDRLDNRWANLRLADASRNTANSLRRRDNLSGFKGVRLHPGSRRWQARLNQASLGLYDTPEEAHAAYCRAAEAAFGEFANHGSASRPAPKSSAVSSRKP